MSIKNQAISMGLAWIASTGLIPASTTTAITGALGIQGQERPFELAAVIVLGFALQTLKPIIDLLPRLTKKLADDIGKAHGLEPEQESKTVSSAPKDNKVLSSDV